MAHDQIEILCGTFDQPAQGAQLLDPEAEPINPNVDIQSGSANPGFTFAELPKPNLKLRSGYRLELEPLVGRLSARKKSSERILNRVAELSSFLVMGHEESCATMRGQVTINRIEPSSIHRRLP
ncbi:hypothetical protein NKH41_32030 [Mesorhizobium sp. M1169]